VEEQGLKACGLLFIPLFSIEKGTKIDKGVENIEFFLVL